MAREIKMTTPIPAPNPFEVEVTAPVPTLKELETALAELAAAGADVIKLIAREARKDVPHADRADLIRLEMAVGDMLFALRPRP